MSKVKIIKLGENAWYYEFPKQVIWLKPWNKIKSVAPNNKIEDLGGSHEKI